MALVAAQTIDVDGLVPTMAAAEAAGDSCVFQGGAAVYFRNTDTTPTDVTFDTPGNIGTGNDLPVPQRVVSVGNQAQGQFVRVDLTEYRQPNGTVRWTYSKVIGMSFAVINQQR